MAHDFVRFPELTNTQAERYYWDSPHKQIFEDFDAKVVRVTDGDTVTLKWDERDFDFPLRLVLIDAPEMNTPDGAASRDHLAGLIDGEDVKIIIDPENRTEKWGRLLGDIRHGGQLMSQEMLSSQNAVLFENRNDTKIPSIEEMIRHANT